MAYKNPETGDNTIVYKGKRYWVVKLDGSIEFDGWNSGQCDFVMYDKLYSATLALIKQKEDGRLEASLLSHVEIKSTYDDMRTLIRVTPMHAEEYFKATSGWVD